MTPEEIRQAFEPWRKKYSRAAWTPATTPTAETESWFGGSPSYSSSDDWPVCAQCQKPMQFFLQLDLAAMPQKFNAVPGQGTVQLFYCSSDDGMCETWDAFSGTHCIRLISDARQPISRPAGLEPLAKTFITGWAEFVDTPHPEEHEKYGISYNYDFAENWVTVKCDDPEVLIEKVDIDLNVAECISEARAGDKLGGWPSWVQGVEYPSCPECQSQMELLLQVDSEDNLPYMFGDVGCAHLTQCRKHPHVLAFAWACG